MEHNTLIYMNEFKVTYRKLYSLYVDTIFVNNYKFSIIKFQVLVARQPYLRKIFPICSATWIYMVARYVC